MCSLLETRCVRRLDHRPHRDELEPFRFCAALPIHRSLLGTDGERRVIDQGEPEVSTRRTSMVIAAVVLGGIASFSLYRHLDGIERQVYADARPVEVVVVDVAIAAGTSGDQALTGAVSTRPMPAEFRPATAVASPEAIRGKVAALDLPVGTIVVENMFVDAEQARDTNAELIPEGMVAVSISVDQVRGVSGLVRPGDKVNMIVEDPTSPGTKQVLFQNVDVLFVGQTPAPQPGDDPAVAAAAAPAADPAAGGLLTLAVPPLAASKIALVSDAGIYLALVPSDNVPVPVPPVNGDNLLTGELTPGVTEGV
jgi:pilus assembly protein CpaB